MSSFDAFIEKAVLPGHEQLIPGCVALAVDRKGVFYEKCAGTQSLNPDSPLFRQPLTPATTMWIASCTKLMTAIAALQCVERGLFTLDDDVCKLLPELKNARILTGFDSSSGAPTYKPSTGKITLRTLLTHSSGLGYDFTSPELMRLRAYNRKQPRPSPKPPTFDRAYLYPLLFEPNSSWIYGVGVDWAGRMIERATQQRLETYMATHIWQPAGMQQTTFRLAARPDVRAARADMALRLPGGALAPSPTRYVADELPDDSGGGGVWSCAADYARLLGAVLRDGDEQGSGERQRLLRRESVDVLFAPCLAPAAERALNRALFTTADGGERVVPASAKPSYAPGGLVVQEDVIESVEGEKGRRRRKGSLAWGGLPNLKWMIDRETGIALFLGAQLIPSDDENMNKVFQKFEQAVYDDLVIPSSSKI